MAVISMKSKRAKNEEVHSSVSGKEILGHALGGVGQNFIFAFWSGYMMMFYTDVFGLTAAFVGLLFFGARIWDAINDPMMGMLADRTRTRWGRFRPWLLFMPLVIGICLVLNFTIPSLSGKSAMVYAVITYMMMSMAFTAVDIPYWSMPSAMTTDPNTRTKIFSFSRLSTSLASVVAGIFIIPLINVMGGGDMAKGFCGAAIVIAIIGAIFYLISFSLVREHVPGSTEKFNYKKAFQALSQNKPLMIALGAALACNLGLIIKMSLQLYYVQYNLGSLDLIPIFSFLALPGIVLGSLMTPSLCKKFGKKTTLIGSNVCMLGIGI
ncbi:MAG: glycoside-pentoside-hexuronide (GPH):cation symporter, partial [Turicibacter sp.]